MNATHFGQRKQIGIKRSFGQECQVVGIWTRPFADLIWRLRLGSAAVRTSELGVRKIV